jgi:hypothetical protein
MTELEMDTIHFEVQERMFLPKWQRIKNNTEVGKKLTLDLEYFLTYINSGIC